MKNILNYIPRFYRMRVKWVGGIYTNKHAPDYEENIWIFKLWGNPRNIACSKAMFWGQLKQREELNGYNCVSAWYNPVDFREILRSLKFKFRYFGI